MLTFLIAVLAGLICGVLSGFGIGGGSLLYFLPTAACSLFFHVKNKQIVWRAVIPAALAGCLTAIPGALLASNLDTGLLRKLFGGFLVLVGISEVFFKGKKSGSSS